MTSWIFPGISQDHSLKDPPSFPFQKLGTFSHYQSQDHWFGTVNLASHLIQISHFTNKTEAQKRGFCWRWQRQEVIELWYELRLSNSKPITLSTALHCFFNSLVFQRWQAVAQHLHGQMSSVLCAHDWHEFRVWVSLITTATFLPSPHLCWASIPC